MIKAGGALAHCDLQLHSIAHAFWLIAHPFGNIHHKVAPPAEWHGSYGCDFWQSAVIIGAGELS